MLKTPNDTCFCTLLLFLSLIHKNVIYKGIYYYCLLLSKLNSNIKVPQTYEKYKFE